MSRFAVSAVVSWYKYMSLDGIIMLTFLLCQRSLAVLLFSGHICNIVPWHGFWRISILNNCMYTIYTCLPGFLFSKWKTVLLGVVQPWSHESGFYLDHIVWKSDRGLGSILAEPPAKCLNDLTSLNPHVVVSGLLEIWWLDVWWLCEYKHIVHIFTQS